MPRPAAEKGAKGVHILALMGSPRRGGNTDVLTEVVLRAARAVGATTEKVVLDDLDLPPIRNCRLCRQEGGGSCARPGDVFFLLERLGQADLLLFATPLYWYGMSAQLKAFVDRWSCDTEAAVRLVEGARLALLCPRSEPPERVLESLRDQFRLLASYCGMEYLGDFSAVADRQGEVAEQEDTLRRAQAWGRMLGSLPAGRRTGLLKRRGDVARGLETLGRWLPGAEA
jgi:NAD(P)H-dependent FMN reductase